MAALHNGNETRPASTERATRPHPGPPPPTRCYPHINHIAPPTRGGARAAQCSCMTRCVIVPLGQSVLSLHASHRDTRTAACWDPAMSGQCTEGRPTAARPEPSASMGETTNQAGGTSPWELTGCTFKSVRHNVNEASFFIISLYTCHLGPEQGSYPQSLQADPDLAIVSHFR